MSFHVWASCLFSLLIFVHSGSAFATKVILEDPEDYNHVVIDFERISSISFEAYWYEEDVSDDFHFAEWNGQPLQLKDEKGQLRNYLIYCDLETELTKVRNEYLNDRYSGYPWLIHEILDKFHNAFKDRITFRDNSLPLTILNYEVRAQMKSTSGRIPIVIPHGQPIPVEILFPAIIKTWFTKNLNGRIVIDLATP